MSGRKLAAAAVLVVFAPLGVAAQTYRVVVHKDHPATSIERKELANIFLGMKTKWESGVAVAPVEQSLRSTVRAEFAREILKRSPSAVLEYWKRELQRGTKRPPGVKPTDSDVIGFVASKPGAIGYVSAAWKIDESVKVLEITE